MIDPDDESMDGYCGAYPMRAVALQRALDQLPAAEEAQMALCQLDWIGSLPGVHPHRVEIIRHALERLASAESSHIKSSPGSTAT